MIELSVLPFIYAFGLVIFVLGIQSIIFFPLTMVYELWKKNKLGRMSHFKGKVTVLVPAYNEERTIRQCVESVLNSDYPSFEVIVINDGSTDGTEARIVDLVAKKKIKYIKKRNGGKASALNMGISAAEGEVIVYTDADSFFVPNTLRKIARWFGEPKIDAVCGNDAPLNPATYIQKFLAVTTHIGTGFVRRALSVMGCLPIITGNLGAVRASVLKEIGGFREIWGEDLELTFRLHRHKKKIIFDPDPKVIAECPGTIKLLWKQRVRWMRSYLKIARLNKDLFLRKKYAPFSYYLPVNFFNMTIIPLMQLLVLPMIVSAYVTGSFEFANIAEIMTYLGVGFFFAVAVYSIVMDGDFRDLVYIPYGYLILPFSYFYNVVIVFSWCKEALNAEEKWEKIERRRLED